MKTLQQRATEAAKEWYENLIQDENTDELTDRPEAFVEGYIAGSQDSESHTEQTHIGLADWLQIFEQSKTTTNE